MRLLAGASPGSRCRKAAAVVCLLQAVAAGFAATRPHYGGTLRVEIHEAIETPDPPQNGPGLADLSAAFTITRWEGAQAAFVSNENAPGGRPFLDGVEVRMGQPLRDQSIALEVGRADIVELGPSELRRQPPGRQIWRSAPVRIVALVFGPGVEERIREALALAVDRTAIHSVLLQRNGEISGALLPQWLSGYAFVFPAVQDLAKAKSLLASTPASARVVTLDADDPALRPIADRVALDARSAGLTVSVTSRNPNAAVRLVEARVAASDPAQALAGLAASFGLPQPPKAPDLYSAEHLLLEDFRVVPLFHLPLIYGVHPRVKGGPGITPLGQWRFERLWIDNAKP